MLLLLKSGVEVAGIWKLRIERKGRNKSGFGYVLFTTFEALFIQRQYTDSSIK